MAARNSRKLMDALSRRFGGNSYRQARPCVEKPPMPHSQASEYRVLEGEVIVMLLMLEPMEERYFMKYLQRRRSLMSHEESFIVCCFLRFLFLCSLNLSRVRKKRPRWMM